jgi:hypothetical protein
MFLVRAKTIERRRAWRCDKPKLSCLDQFPTARMSPQRRRLSGNSREWVRFSEEWDKIAQMCERLLATMSTGDQRPTGPKSKALAAE